MNENIFYVLVKSTKKRIEPKKLIIVYTPIIYWMVLKDIKML
jgi:hypothetical protein